MKTVVIIIVAVLSSSSARLLTQSALSALQDILSPANTDKAMQILKMAAPRFKTAKPERARAVAFGELPMATRYAYLPARLVPSNELPVRVIASDGYTRVLGNPEVAQKVIKQVPVREIQQAQPNLIDSLVMPKEIFQPFIQDIGPCTPVASNPYLPVPSPVSAMSPARMPPPTQSKGQFLRKIPIPPPTL